MKYDIVIIGGFGRVGLPLAIAFAGKGLRVCAFDIDRETGEIIARGKMPFVEERAEELLTEVIASGNLELSYDPEVISQTDTVIIIIGTPVDKHLNPEFELMRKMMDSYLDYFKDGQLVVLRSTVYPGTTEKLYHWFCDSGKKVEMAFCPERIAEGFALRELEELPQIISAITEQGLAKCEKLFKILTDEVVVLSPIEAELAKLFTNVWRYIKFATANQFFMIANEHKADFYRIHHAMTFDYERAKDLPQPGFAAGTCLFKDAMQLAAFNNNSFYLGHAAMLINEGLPNYLVDKLKQRYDLHELTAGILGMAFKANIDDKRESLSYKLKKMLMFECRKVLCSDVYIRDEEFVSPEELIRECDLIILATPHREYASLDMPDDKTVVDIWNLWGKGCVV